jgi:hypothetical protein
MHIEYAVILVNKMFKLLISTTVKYYYKNRNTVKLYISIYACTRVSIIPEKCFNYSFFDQFEIV